MKTAYIIIGLIIGAWFGGIGQEVSLGALGGAMIGWVLARLKLQEQRIAQLESARPAGRDRTPESPAPRPQEAGAGGRDEPAVPSWRDDTVSGDATQPATAPGLLNKPLATPANWSKPATSAAGPSLLQIGLKKAGGWLTTGNVPVKIGVIVTFIGISFLLKYAIDRELFRFPIEFRLLGVAILGLTLVIIGWRLKGRMRVYSLSLQGGGVGILFLTIFAAFRIWQLLPGPLAFFLLVALTASTAALAVLQNSRWLAILGITGGFLAPVLTSTGQGSHVALFSYYLLLNLAVVGIAWFRAWRSLNLVGFFFTFLIGTLWGYQYYRPEFLVSTMPFLVAHFLLYHAVAILYALRQPPERIGMVDGSLVFGTPAIVFALQSQLLKDSEYGLAISAAIAALIYVFSAIVLWRKQGHYLRLLTESFVALAVAFATITIPLALDARWTSAAWALEGAALVWVGMRQRHHLANLAGVALLFLSGASFLEYGWKSNHGMAVFNGNVLGGLMISLGSMFASRKLKPTEDFGYRVFYELAALGLFLWGALWWLGTGVAELSARLPLQFDYGHAFAIFLALTFSLAVWTSRKLEWAMLRNSTLIYLPLLMLVAVFTWTHDQHLLFRLGWLAWPLAWVVQAGVLKNLEAHELRLTSAWHFLSVLSLAMLVATEAWWWVDDALTQTWAGTVSVTVTGILALLVWRMRTRPTWPVPSHPLAYLYASLLLVSFQVIWLTGLSLDNPGNPAPLPYFPVLNPYDLALLFALVVVRLSFDAVDRETSLSGEFSLLRFLPAYKLMMAVLVFILTTLALVRGVHHYAPVRWDGDALANSVIVQTSLSIYWGVLGFTGMILGARRQRRPVWLIGAGFMALVVVKLFLVDLGNSGTVERIVSFMGIGALLLVVGYFAPAPPRHAKAAEGDVHTGGEAS